MEWVKNCDRVCHPKLVHNQKYRVKLDTDHIIYAKFWVYSGGEEVAFVLPETHAELSVTEIFI